MPLRLLRLDEGSVRHHGLDGVLGALDAQLGSRVAVLDRNHRLPDVLVQPWRVARRGDLADPLAVDEHGGRSPASNHRCAPPSARWHLDTDEPSDALANDSPTRH